MGTFGGGVTFGGGGGSTSSTGVPLSSILIPMLRAAGITVLPGTTPNVDQFTELIPMVNDMMDSWSCDGHLIFSSSIDQYPLTTNQKIYTIGPGGDFDNARPVSIKLANILFPTSPVVRRQVKILDDNQWSSIAVQDVTGAPPYELYYDGSLNSDGRGQIYLRFQPPAGYILELYTWEALQSNFTDVTDVAIFPPGYVEAIKWNGALRTAALYPLEAKLSSIAPEMARSSLRTLIELNTHSHEIGTDAALCRDEGDGGHEWLHGGFR